MPGLRVAPAPAPYTKREFFCYNFNPPVLGAAASGVQFQLLIDTDSDFLWDRISGLASGAFSVYVEDISRGIRLIGSPNYPIRDNALAIIVSFGAPYQFATPVFNEGMWLPKPFLLKRGTVLMGQFNNLSGANNRIQLVLIGQKVS